MSKALIISVGGSIEPIVSSIAEHCPSLVVFFASEQTIESIGTIKARLQEQNIAIDNRNVMTANAEDLEDCYTKALECAEIVLDRERPPAQMVVDLTPGTKAMTAALTLATAGRGFAYSYVGGGERSKKGGGVVVSGTERVLHRRDPLILHAVDEHRRLARYFNAFQFQAAKTLARELQARPILEPNKVAFEFIGDLATGYESWDRFLFEDAQRALKSACRKWAPVIRAAPSLRYADLQPTVEAHVVRLELILDKTRRLREVHLVLAEELLANAARRGEEGKFDDAIVRLYRALELGGQIAIQRTLGCGTDKVPVIKLPGPLREEYQRKYEHRDSPSFVQIPLEATYRLLEALAQPEGEQFMSRAGEIKKIQSARNDSWLAHGLGPCRAQTHDTLSSLVREILNIEKGPSFPKLDESI